MVKVFPTVQRMTRGTSLPLSENGAAYDVTESENDDFDVSDSDKLCLCVRGTEYVMDVNKLSRAEPDSRMYRLVAKWRQLNENSDTGQRKSMFINRNPHVFHCIVDYYVTGQLHLPDGVCGSQLSHEMRYWGIGYDVIAPCCLWKLHEGNDI